MHRNQSGFSAVEAILILAIIAILSFAGWFVWHSQKTADKTLSETNTSTTATPKKTTGNSQKYLVIKEWGIKIPLSDDLSGLEYTMKTVSGGEYAAVTFSSLKGGAMCGDDQAVGTVSRFTVDAVNPDTNNKMTQDYPDAAKIGTYYYFAGLPQAACDGSDGGNSAEQEKVSNARKPFADAVNKATQE